MAGKLVAALVLAFLCNAVCAEDNSTATTVATGNSGGSSDAEGKPYETASDYEPIKCYECSSTSDGKGDCYDPIKLDELKSVECKSGICLKYIQNVEKDIKQIDRGCADNIEPALIAKKKKKDVLEGCVLSTGTKLVKVQICTCLTENCNGVADMKSSVMMVLVPSVLVMLVAKMMQ